jgi:hypothetical protein
MCFQLHDDLRTYGTEHAFDCQRRRLLAMDKNFIQTVKKTFFVVILVVRSPGFLDPWAATQFMDWAKISNVEARRLRMRRIL